MRCLALALCCGPAWAGDLPVGTVTTLAGEAQALLAPGARTGDRVMLVLVDPAADRVVLVPAALGAARGEAAPAGPDAQARGAFALSRPLPADTYVGFVLTGDPGVLEVQGRTVLADLDGDGTAERLTACLTSEAISLRIEGEAGPLWEDYMPLGYDVEPTCP